MKQQTECLPVASSEGLSKYSNNSCVMSYFVLQKVNFKGERLKRKERKNILSIRLDGVD
jgi:hypothetical protein